MSMWNNKEYLMRKIKDDVQYTENASLCPKLMAWKKKIKCLLSQQLSFQIMK